MWKVSNEQWGMSKKWVLLLISHSSFLASHFTVWHLVSEKQSDEYPFLLLNSHCETSRFLFPLLICNFSSEKKCQPFHIFPLMSYLLLLTFHFHFSLWVVRCNDNKCEIRRLAPHFYISYITSHFLCLARYFSLLFYHFSQWEAKREKKQKESKLWEMRCEKLPTSHYSLLMRNEKKEVRRLISHFFLLITHLSFISSPFSFSSLISQFWEVTSQLSAREGSANFYPNFGICHRHMLVYTLPECFGLTKTLRKSIPYICSLCNYDSSDQ